MNSLIAYTLNIIVVLMSVWIAWLGETRKEIIIWAFIGGVNLLSALNIGAEIIKTIK